MAIKSKLFFVIASVVLALSTSAFSSDDLPSIMHESMQVRPLAAVSSPGQTLSLDVRCEGIIGVGTIIPLKVTGTPEGTNIEIIALSEQHALVNLVFPITVARGVWVLTVKVGSPTPLVEQKVEIEIGG